MTRNEKYEKIKKELLKLIKEDYGDNCETKDTVDSPEMIGDPSWGRCPVCLVYEKLDELYEAIDLEEYDETETS